MAVLPSFMGFPFALKAVATPTDDVVSGLKLPVKIIGRGPTPIVVTVLPGECRQTARR
jgi:hypothetical protein